jgi:hypothetical protein
VRFALTLAAIVSSLAAFAAPPAPAATAPGSGSASCLRGNWVAGLAETRRVMRALVPVGGYEVTGKLYMIFREGAFQYGSTGLVIENTIGEARMKATGRFFTLAPYSARTGLLSLSRGSSTMEWSKFTATKAGKTFSVAGPAPTTRRVPGGTVPFRCTRASLQVRLPAFASLDWITLRRS